MTWQTLQEHEAHYLPFFQDDYRRKSLERLAQRFVTGRRVLEVRCLTGHLAVELAQRGFEVTALDGLSEAVSSANAYGRSRGLTYDITRPWDLEHLTEAVAGAQFDTVICLDTLPHVPDDKAFLKQLHQVVAPGGRLILNGPAFPGLHGRRDAALGHLRRYTRGSFRALVASHGFELEVLRWWNFTGLPLYALLEGLLRVEVKEGLRHGRRGAVNRVTSRLLRSWYLAVENHVRFPLGLSLLAVARRTGTDGGAGKHRERG